MQPMIIVKHLITKVDGQKNFQTNFSVKNNDMEKFRE